MSVPAPVTAPAVNVKAVPVQIVVVDGVRLAMVGLAFTVTDGERTDVVLVQPVPEQVTVKVYTPLEAVVVGVNVKAILWLVEL